MKRDKSMQKLNRKYSRPSSRAIKNRKRLRLLPIIILLLMSIMGTTVPQHRSNTYQVQEEYLVQPGDTLWSIATNYAEHGDDLRLMIDRMVEANHLGDGCALKPGDKIIVVLDERELPL